MPWLKIDDHFADHPKVRAAGPLAVWVHLQALCYASRYLTDGFIPESVIPSLVSGLQMIEQAGDNWPDILVLEGLWERKKGGFLIHDFLDFNPSRAQILSDRERRKEAGSKGGQASAKARGQALRQADRSATVSSTVRNVPNPPSRTRPVREGTATVPPMLSSHSAPDAPPLDATGAPGLEEPKFTLAELQAQAGMESLPPPPGAPILGGPERTATLREKAKAKLDPNL
jgi:hypothetical protein